MPRPFFYFLNLLSTFLIQIYVSVFISRSLCVCDIDRVSVFFFRLVPIQYVYFFSLFSFLFASLFPIKSILLSNYHREKLQFTFSCCLFSIIHPAIVPAMLTRIMEFAVLPKCVLLLFFVRCCSALFIHLKWIVFVCLFSFILSV